MSIQVAMRCCEEAGARSVNRTAGTVPPVCKVLDYGKYRFEQRKEKEAKKNQKVVEVKDRAFAQY